jgi:hypothetical protein
MGRGIRLVHVFGRSMGSTVPAGSMAVAVPTGGRDLERGDVVLVRAGEGHVVHRVVASGARALVHRGDGDDARPGLARADDVVGRVVWVWRPGETAPRLLGREPGRVGGAERAAAVAFLSLDAAGARVLRSRRGRGPSWARPLGAALRLLLARVPIASPSSRA